MSTLTKSDNEPLRWREVAQAVRQQQIGHSMVYRTKVDSTMEVCHALARAGAESGAVVAADSQSAGRGRQGRAWHAPPSTCLLFSVLLRPTLKRGQWLHVLWPLAVALQEATEHVTGLRAAIKWPNDLILCGKKLGGLLAETTADAVVVGAGLNVNFPAGALSLDQPVATVSDALGRHISREELFIESLRSFDHWYRRWLAAPDEVWQAWRDGAHLIGQPVDVSVGGNTFSGTAEEQDRNGRLCVRAPDGRVRRFTAGDASVRQKGAM